MVTAIHADMMAHLSVLCIDSLYLHVYRDANRVNEEWFSDMDAVRAAVGMVDEAADPPGTSDKVSSGHEGTQGLHLYHPVQSCPAAGSSWAHSLAHSETASE